MTIQNYLNTLKITEETTSRDIYNFLNNSPANITQSQKIESTSMEQNVAPIILYSVSKNNWKKTKLTFFDKNYIYCFLMNSYLDKQNNWLKNLVLHTLCFACGEEIESWDHLIYSCEELNRLTLKLNIFSRKD